MFIKIILIIDWILKNFIFLPMAFILACNFFPRRLKPRKHRLIYRFCIALVILFMTRYFLDKFIFTGINYSRFSDSILFPLIKAIFYPEY